MRTSTPVSARERPGSPVQPWTNLKMTPLRLTVLSGLSGTGPVSPFHEAVSKIVKESGGSFPRDRIENVLIQLSGWKVIRIENGTIHFTAKTGELVEEARSLIDRTLFDEGRPAYKHLDIFGEFGVNKVALAVHPYFPDKPDLVEEYKFGEIPKVEEILDGLGRQLEKFGGKTSGFYSEALPDDTLSFDESGFREISRRQYSIPDQDRVTFIEYIGKTPAEGLKYVFEHRRLRHTREFPYWTAFFNAVQWRNA